MPLNLYFQLMSHSLPNFSFPRSVRVVAVLAMLVLVPGGCRDDSVVPTDGCATPATVRDLTGFDGCGKVLVLPSGQRLEPSGAAWTTFAAADGQHVIVGYTPTNGASICMVGQTVEVTCIRAAN